MLLDAGNIFIKDKLKHTLIYMIKPGKTSLDQCADVSDGTCND